MSLLPVAEQCQLFIKPRGIIAYFSTEGVAPVVEAFDKLMNSTVADFLKKSRILAGDVETHVSTFSPVLHGKVARLARKGDIGTLVPCWWECQMVWPVQKRVWRFLKENQR